MKETTKKQLFSHKHGKAEIIVFFLYIFGIIFISSFHEPWFDEAQAWQIARCASLQEILFTIPHYEGHPQLWHLLLVPFAKLGAPYELSLHLINTAFSAAAVALLLWRSPFPKIIRCILPFNYFTFYHFGVLSRPYSMMALAFALVAMAYPMRDQKPLRYILSLIFLCMTSAFGIAISCGLCLVWTGEIIREYLKNKKWKHIFHDRRPYVLFGILIFAILLLLCLIPAKDCYYDTYDASFRDKLSRWQLLIIMPFESFWGCYMSNNELHLTAAGTIVDYIGGVITWVILLLFLHANRKKCFFLVPYLLYCGSAFMVFFATHHLGISALYMIFAFWVIWEENGTLIIPPLLIKMAEKIQSVWIMRLSVGVVCFLTVISPICSIVSSVYEIRYCYSLACVADFIKENNIDDRKLMVLWTYEYQMPETDELIDTIIFDETLPADLPETTYSNPYLCGIPVAIEPYFEKNIFMNFNSDKPECLYDRWLNDCDLDTMYAQWREEGLPDLVFGLVPLQDVYTEEELKGVTYDWIDTLEYGSNWKLIHNEYEIKVYIRSDLLDEYPQFEKQTYAQKAKEPD